MCYVRTSVEAAKSRYIDFIRFDSTLSITSFVGSVNKTDLQVKS